MPTAEIVTIGTELLLGEIQDTNTQYIARIFRDNGIDIYRGTIVGDNAARVAQAIRESMQRANITITTGGLGPTVDDPTRQAVALALNTELEFRPDLWEQIQARFKRYGRSATDNNKRQAYIPQGSIPVENLVGTAPAFIAQTDPEHVLISLPGVPKEMEFLIDHDVLPFLRQRFNLHGIIKAHVLHTSGVGESQVDEWIGDLEELSNPTVGLLAHAGQVDIRITAKADTVETADQMINDLAIQIRERLGDAIFGKDNQTLEQVVFQKLSQHGWQLCLSEYGTTGKLAERLMKNGLPPGYINISPLTGEMNTLKDHLKDQCAQTKAEVGLGINFIPGNEKQLVDIVLTIQGNTQEINRSYGGPPAMGTQWASNVALDFLRRNL